MRPKQAKKLDSSSLAENGPGATGPRWRLPYRETPRAIQLETVTVCNAKCPFCPQHEIKRQPPRMPDDIWRKIVDETRGLSIRYRPFLTNEPFVDKRQPEIAAHIKQNDPTAEVEYNTNGELVTEELGRRLLDTGIDLIRFSIDGFSRQTYEKSRVGVSHEKVYRRVSRFLEIWDKEGYRDSTFTEIRLIQTPETAPEIGDFKAFWGPRCSEVVLTDLYQWPWTGQSREDVVRKPCLKILDEMFFYSNGLATLCCWDVQERAVIGDVKEQSVLEIWQGYAARHLRGLLDDGRRDLLQLCSRCDAYREFDFSTFEES